jgi:hypothetical protein
MTDVTSITGPKSENFSEWRGPFLNGFLSGIDRYQPDNQKEFEVEEGVQ